MLWWNSLVKTQLRVSSAGMVSIYPPPVAWKEHVLREDESVRTSVPALVECPVSSVQRPVATAMSRRAAAC